MAFEIERKYLLANGDWRKITDKGLRIRQGYLNANPQRTVRVRQVFIIPEWIGKEVSGDIKYYNSNLIRLPFKEW
ncbi:MAG: adenylate cyclase [Saprospiraceae bacterium]|jgi:adenylate cyclase